MERWIRCCLGLRLGFVSLALWFGLGESLVRLVKLFWILLWKFWDRGREFASPALGFL